MLPATPLRVLFTVDTEFWPRDPGIASRPARGDLLPERDWARDTLGHVAGGSFGVPFQLEVLRRYGLRGVFFVEALSASVVGPELLQRTVELIREGGQDVQLHLHTEWLRVEPNEVLPGRIGQHIRQFTPEEQIHLIRTARDNLTRAGGGSITAFRAGNFGASWDILPALRAAGLSYDSSHNAAHLANACDMPTVQPLRQAIRRDDVWEVPVSCFEDWPGHVRPAQVTACSSREMIHVLQRARGAGWKHFVIVFHSHELLNARHDGPNPVVLKRFQTLCRFLAENRTAYETTTFADLDNTALESATVPHLRSAPWLTAWRYGEQLAQRFA